jgi:hypothetical protein
MDAMVESSEREIDRLYEMFPSEMREQLDELRAATEAGEQGDRGPITEEDKKMILDDLDTFFRTQTKEDQG